MSTSRLVYEPIVGVERLEHYQPGGYHPVHIGDYLHNRYRIVHKLGHGPCSTTWLARDRQLSAYAAVMVGTANPHQHEFDVLSRINNAPPEHKSTEKPLLPAILDQFNICGPNGTHRCLVTNPARCSLAGTKDASSSCLFQLGVARALAAQLAIAIAQVHNLAYVHGNLHLGNVLLHSPPGLDYLSEDQLYEKFGAPEIEPIVRLDGMPLPPNVPSHAVSPVRLGEPSEDTSLSDAKLILVGFESAFRPSEESRFQSHLPLEIRPPEACFEPSTPLSFPSDIWSLGCAIWAIIGHGSLFDNLIANQDIITCEQVDALGRLPPDWWAKWDARSQKFNEAGEPVQGRSMWTWGERFEDSIEDPRRRKDMGTLDAEEKDAFFVMMRWMLEFRPSDRATADQVLETAWMRDWAVPSFRKGVK
ncbi:hypothetical protein AK830_g8397 [Neonectria ditissima]|uniref:Protein kinase domain-containing protein n=1 Tax=Neonectria ditissima TaxID=78410 RepID=A0A0P7AXJ6_9HYPO|nr:hypothetical protein AK830_g8397 [Neonectria ditissima]